MKHKLAIDLSTDRVIWFTPDLDYDIQIDERSAVTLYDGPLPSDMTVTNCWGWVYRERQLVRSSPRPSRVSRMEQNRTDTLEWIRSQVFDFRHRRYNRDSYTLLLEYSQNRLPKDLLDFLDRTEIIKQTAVNKTHHAVTDQDLADVRAELKQQLDHYATTL